MQAIQIIDLIIAVFVATTPLYILGLHSSNKTARLETQMHFVLLKLDLLHKDNK